MNYVLISVSLIVLLTIASGVYLIYTNTDPSKKKLKKALAINLFAIIPVLIIAMFLVVPNFSSAATGASDVNGLGLIGVALATGLACVGAGVATGAVGSSAIGAISEDPKMLGKSLIYIGLAEGIAIYGIVISIIILGKLG